jgi:hypothetical protein
MTSDARMIWLEVLMVLGCLQLPAIDAPRLWPLRYPSWCLLACATPLRCWRAIGWSRRSRRSLTDTV